MNKRYLVILIILGFTATSCSPILMPPQEWDEMVYENLAKRATHEKEFSRLMDSVNGNPSLILDTDFILQVMVAHDNAVIAGDTIIETSPPPAREVEYRMLSEAFQAYENGGNMLISGMAALDREKVTEGLKLLEEYNASMNAFMDYMQSKQTT